VAVVTIETDYDGDVRDDGLKETVLATIYVGYLKFAYRIFLRFPLDALPAGSTVNSVTLILVVKEPGGAAHLLDVHAYNLVGQADPEVDTGLTLWDRCASGQLYLDDSIDLRTVGSKSLPLGGTVCSDVEAAKAAVNRFSLGLHEEGDNDDDAGVAAIEHDIYPPARLQIDYTPPPVVGYQYSDGLVTVRVG